MVEKSCPEKGECRFGHYLQQNAIFKKYYYATRVNHWHQPRLGLALPISYKPFTDKFGTRCQKGHITAAMIDMKNPRACDVVFELYYSLKSTSPINRNLKISTKVTSLSS